MQPMPSVAASSIGTPPPSPPPTFPHRMLFGVPLILGAAAFVILLRFFIGNTKIGPTYLVLWHLHEFMTAYLPDYLPPLTALLLTTLLGVYMFYELHWKRRLLPPGPVPWLMAGNMPQVLMHGAKNIDALLQRWRVVYGGVFTFWMGPIPMVMVSDVELLRHYFVRHGDVFSGRWQNFITHTFMDGHNGVIQVQGDKWREQRRFALHLLRDFGLGRAQMEEKIRVEVRALVAHLEEKMVAADGNCCKEEGGSKPMEIGKPVAVCIANIIINILFGKTYAHEDPAFIRVQQILDRQSSLVVQPIMGLYLSMQWTTKVPLINGPWRELLSIRNDFWAFLEGHIQEHRHNLGTDELHQQQQQQQPSDFTYAYLMEMEQRRQRHKAETAAADNFVDGKGGGRNDGEGIENGNGMDNGDGTAAAATAMGHFSDKQLKMLLLDLFFAGSETTVTTTKWGILLLVWHPDVQERCFHELMETIGQREPELKDRAKLTYLNATICEIQRLANILPINLLRTCMETVEMDGYRFEQGTMVLPQISITLNDPVYFPEPNAFRPERFIDKANGNLRRLDAFLPFSIGKRQCLGESLARAELFLIFAFLIRHFQFCPERADVLPSRERIYGLTVSPQPYKCCLHRRCQTANNFLFAKSASSCNNNNCKKTRGNG